MVLPLTLSPNFNYIAAAPVGGYSTIKEYIAMIECRECKYLFYNDFYLECAKCYKGKCYKGIVNYNDTCEHAEPKEREDSNNGERD